MSNRKGLGMLGLIRSNAVGSCNKVGAGSKDAYEYLSDLIDIVEYIPDDMYYHTVEEMGGDEEAAIAGWLSALKKRVTDVVFDMSEQEAVDWVKQQFSSMSDADIIY